jgi:uncharacterized protein YoxC
MNARKLLIGTVFAIGIVLAPAQSVLAEGETLKSAEQAFQQQIQNSMDQLKKAIEVRDRAIQVMADETKGAKEAPQQITAMIESLKGLNSGFDEGSQFRTTLDAVAAFLDQQIADLLADPDQTVREAADSMKVRREQVAELQKQTLELVERGKTLIRKLEDRRRVMEKLITVEKMDTVISVAREALDQYKNALAAFEGVAERSNSYVVPGS